MVLRRETGGDGIYINTAWDITLSRILIDGGYRNGISVIAVQQLLVEHSIVRNTFGTDPEAVSSCFLIEHDAAQRRVGLLRPQLSVGSGLRGWI
jgi:hypothetical protein